MALSCLPPAGLDVGRNPLSAMFGHYGGNDLTSISLLVETSTSPVNSCIPLELHHNLHLFAVWFPSCRPSRCCAVPFMYTLLWAKTTHRRDISISGHSLTMPIHHHSFPIPWAMTTLLVEILHILSCMLLSWSPSRLRSHSALGNDPLL